MAISLNIISFIILVLIQYININYTTYYYLNSYIILMMISFDFIVMYCINIIFAFVSLKNEEKEILDLIKNNFQNTLNTESIESKKSEDSKKSNYYRKCDKSNLSQKILELHYKKSLNNFESN